MKFIVYLTINTTNNKIYVGVHKTMNPFKFDGYIGNGIKVNDPHTYKHCKTPFQTAVHKYGPKKFQRITLHVFDTVEEALEMEKLIVTEEFLRNPNNYNAAVGGGMPPSPNKEIFQYEVTGEFIRRWDSITNASLKYDVSSSSIGRAVLDRTVSCGYLWTDYMLDEVNPENFNFASNKKNVHKYDSQGNYVESFDSYADAAKDNGCVATSINKSIHGGIRINGFYYSDKLSEKFHIARNQFSVRPVHQYSLEGEYIQSFRTLADAAKAVDCNPTSISKGIKKGITTKGFQWSFEKVKFMKKYTKNTTTRFQSRKVGQYTLDGQLVKIYDSVRNCAKDFSRVSDVLKGRVKYTKGYTFKYED